MTTHIMEVLCTHVHTHTEQTHALRQNVLGKTVIIIVVSA